MKLALIGSSLLLAPCLAFGITDFLNPQSFAPKDALAKSAKAAVRTECTDFSGNWVGKCAWTEGDDSSEARSSVRVQQSGCHMMIFGESEYHYVGGVKRSSNSLPSGSWSHSVSMDWNKSGDEIIVRTTGDGRTFDESYKLLFSSKGQSLLKMDGPRLVISGEFTNQQTNLKDGVEVETTDNVTCTYEKQG